MRSYNFRVLKRLLSLALIIFLICTLTGCRENALPEPELPLSEEALTRAVGESGFSWVLSKEETQSYAEGHIAYVLRDPTARYSEESETTRLCASVSSAELDGERFLSLIFDSAPVSTDNGKKQLPFAWEDWKPQLELAARLYGGFRDTEALYRAFAEQAVTEDTQFFSYQAWFPNAYCRISYSVRDTRLVHSAPETTVLEKAAMMRVNIYGSEALYQKQQAEAEANKAEWERARTDPELLEKLLEELENRKTVQ